jgi:small subunit ribosomal protein S18
MIAKKKLKNRTQRCKFCTKEGCPRPAFVDYKDVASLKKLVTAQGKLYSRKRSNLCAAYQRAASVAVKRARFIGLMPFVGDQ